MACVEGENEKTEVLHVTCIVLVSFYMVGHLIATLICQAGNSKSGMVQSTSLTLLPVLCSKDNPQDLGLSLGCALHVANSGHLSQWGLLFTEQAQNLKSFLRKGFALYPVGLAGW